MERAPWFPEWGITYSLGIDGISLLLILLTTFLTVLCVLCSWRAIETRVKEYYITFLFLETAMVGTLCSLDLVLFYIFWELMLIPMYLLIGVWGGPKRVYAAIKFFLFTMAGSVLMLLAIFALYYQFYKTTGTTRLTYFSSITRHIPAGQAVLAVCRVCPLLCHKGPHVPCPHLAAGCAYGGPDRRQCDSGRSASEDGNVRLPEVCHSSLSGGCARGNPAYL